GPLALLIGHVMAPEKLRAEVPGEAPNDADLYEAPPEAPKPQAATPQKKKKKKADPSGDDLAGLAAHTPPEEAEQRLSPQEWLAAHADLLADVEDEDAEPRRRRRRRD
ncbi:MAG TPA: hypothetical protein PKV72_06985, partial [Candidatus Peribacteria bacterium]|nr:hypothetical protein [Candidatus Peribacteria bacterium]